MLITWQVINALFKISKIHEIFLMKYFSNCFSCSKRVLCTSSNGTSLINICYAHLKLRWNYKIPNTISICMWTYYYCIAIFYSETSSVKHSCATTSMKHFNAFQCTGRSQILLLLDWFFVTPPPNVSHF